jgi:hypothetical protein
MYDIDPAIGAAEYAQGRRYVAVPWHGPTARSVALLAAPNSEQTADCADFRTCRHETETAA